MVGPLTAWVGRAGAATRRNLGDSKGQQETTNVEVSSGFAAIDVGSEIPGLRFHTAEAASGQGDGGCLLGGRRLCLSSAVLVSG
jgi:hypothetical protein